MNKTISSILNTYVFYPIFFSTNPILLIYAININDVPLDSFFPIILIVPLLTLGLMWVIYLLIKDIHRTGYIVFLILLWFFYYLPFRIWSSNIYIGFKNWNANWIILPLWTLIFLLLLSNWLWNRIKAPETITIYLNIVSIILLFFSIFRITTNLIPRYIVNSEENLINQSSIAQNNVTSLPDVYYIILDGYGRKDVLQELYHYDNSPFLQELIDRGFSIAHQSQSNYIQTILSIACTLNMEYLTGKASTPPNRGLLIREINQSRTRDYFEKLGYRFVAFSTSYPPTDLTNVEYYFSPSNENNTADLHKMLLTNTILNPFMEKGWIVVPGTKYSVVQERINQIFVLLEKEVPLIKSPKFVFAYIVAPHPPFIFNQYGSIKPDEPYFLQGFDESQERRNEFQSGYIAELTYINKSLLESIDGILANSKTLPIIIIQADHGPDSFMDWSTGKSSCIKERFSILNAYFLPGQGQYKVPENISLINTFPMILNLYFSTNIEFKENHQYFATWKNHFPFLDVTNISQAPCENP